MEIQQINNNQTMSRTKLGALTSIISGLSHGLFDSTEMGRQTPEVYNLLINGGAILGSSYIASTDTNAYGDRRPSLIEPCLIMGTLYAASYATARVLGLAYEVFT